MNTNNEASGCNPYCPPCNTDTSPEAMRSYGAMSVLAEGAANMPCTCGPTCEGNRLDYLAVAEALSGDLSLADLDPAVVEGAAEYAAATGQPWPPEPTATGCRMTVEAGWEW